MKELTLGSLFDGSGGFPLAARNFGITTLWAAEIEPFPIKVTKKNFPTMKHYGNVSNINGAEIEPVDIISFGSPCQDLSIAGKRAGLHGERSVLFFEAIRIIKEMREATNGKYPKWAIWENVKSAFSSNNGEDFRSVLESFAGIQDPDVSIPRLAKGERWKTSGAIMGDEFSIAWRALDAQYWGVPQRRQRIFTVVNFDRGGGAQKVLFKPESLLWATESDSEMWTEGSRCVNSGIETSNQCESKHELASDLVVMDQGGKIIGFEKGMTGTLRAEMHAQMMYIVTNVNNPCVFEDKAGTLCARDYHGPQIAFVTPTNEGIGDGMLRKITPLECCRLQGFPDDWCKDLEIKDPSEEDIEFWKNIFEQHRMAINPNSKPKSEKQIRKWLETPHTDGPEYKMWGNGVALPCVERIFHGIVDYENNREEA